MKLLIETRIEISGNIQDVLLQKFNFGMQLCFKYAFFASHIKLFIIDQKSFGNGHSIINFR